MSNIDMIEAAAERLKGHVRETPLLSSPFLDEIAGRRVLIKPECLQHTGSFKFRGAWSAISALDEAARNRGVIAYSSGNHAQGVAYAAAQHGISSVIVMPSDAPKLKIENTRALFFSNFVLTNAHQISLEHLLGEKHLFLDLSFFFQEI